MNKPLPQTLTFRIKAVIFITVLFSFIGLSLPYPVFSPMFLSEKNAFFASHVSADMRLILLGLSLSLYPLGQFLGSPLLGRLSDYYGRKNLLMISLCITSVSYFVMGIGIAVKHLWIILLSLFICGFSEGNVAIAQSITVDLGAYDDKAKNFGLINIAINVGWIIGPLISGKLADNAIVSWFTYSTPFFFAALLGILNLILVVYAFPKTARANHLNGNLNWHDLVYTFIRYFKRPELRLLYIYAFLGFLSVFFYFYYYAPFMVERFGFGPSQIANFAAYMSVPLIIGNYGIWYVVSRYSLIQLGIISHFLLALSVIIFIIPRSPTALWITIIPIGLMITVSEITSAVLVSNAAGSHEQGTVLGVYRSLQVLSEIAAALIGGLLATISINVPFMASACVAMVAGLLLFYFQSRNKSQ